MLEIPTVPCCRFWQFRKSSRPGYQHNPMLKVQPVPSSLFWKFQKPSRRGNHHNRIALVCCDPEVSTGIERRPIGAFKQRTLDNERRLTDAGRSDRELPDRASSCIGDIKGRAVRIEY